MIESGRASISAVIPCHNGEELLAETLRSALAQTLPPCEVLVVDDGSTDGSAAKAEGFGPPVRVIRQENAGESAARNRGIGEARGEWIAFLDADDLWEPEKLERQLEAAAPGVDAVHTNFYYFGDSQGRVDVSQDPPEVRYSPEHVAVHNPFRISSLMVRRGLDLRFPEWTQHAEDLIYFLELTLCARIALAPGFLTGYRLHAGGQSADPAMAVLRYRSVLEWMKRRKDALDGQAAARIRDGMVRVLAERTMFWKWSRNWPKYWAMRRFLEQQCADHPAVEAVRRERVYPRWMYPVKDAWDRFRGARRDAGDERERP